MPRHVVLLSRDSSLAVALRMLLGEADVVTEIDRPVQWPTASELAVSTAVVDLPAGWRLSGVEQVRARFSGPLVVLLGQDEDAGGIPTEYACTVMRRPFEIMTLWSLVTGATGTPAAPAPQAAAPQAAAPGTVPEAAPNAARKAARPEPTAGTRGSVSPEPPKAAPPPPAAPPSAPPASPPVASPVPPPLVVPPVAPPPRPAPAPAVRPAQKPAAPPAAKAPAPRTGRPAGELDADWSGRLRRFQSAPAAPASGQPEPAAAAAGSRPEAPVVATPAVAAPLATPASAAKAEGEGPAGPVPIAPEDASPLPALPVQERLRRLRDLPRTSTSRAKRGAMPGGARGPIPTAPLPDREQRPGPAGPLEDAPAHGPQAAPASPWAASPHPAPAAVPVPRSQPLEPPWPPRRPPIVEDNFEALLAELRAAVAEAQPAAPPSGRGGAPRRMPSHDPVAEALGGQPPEFYERDLPQRVIEQTAERTKADIVALLLDNGEGVLEVWAGTGLSAAERRLRVDYTREVIRELFRVGVGLIDSTERDRSALAAIPGSEAETLAMVPLVHHGLGFGTIIAGRRQQPSGPPPPFSDPEVETLMDLANDLAPSLRTAVLVRKLRRQLAQR